MASQVPRIDGFGSLDLGRFLAGGWPEGAEEVGP